MRIIRGCFFLLLLQACASSSVDESKNEVDILESTSANESIREEGLIWHFRDQFDSNFKDTLKLWVIRVKEACFETVGEYPFAMNIFFHKSESKQREGVVFGHTDRSKENLGLHLYVIEHSSYESLISDWIAPHEMSHLAIRPVGRNNKWFAEGFATYLSRRIMVRLGYYSEGEFETLYATKIAETKPFYQVGYPFSERSVELFDEYQYSTVYWAGAGFFYRADQALQAHSDMRFEQLLQNYQKAGRKQDKNFAQLIASWDKIAGFNLFEELISEYRNGSSREIMSRF